MSISDRALRPQPTDTDAAIERYLRTLGSRVEPDPLFRRRLRTDVLNRFVAAREGTGGRARTDRPPGDLGRLGRACLYATVGLAVGSTSVLATAEHALPGETLYPLKLRIEQLRLEVLPDHLRGELAGYALGQRIQEMTRLATSGQVSLALAMAPAIDFAYEELVALRESVGPVRSARIERHLVVLDALLARLPPSARDVVEQALSGEPAAPAGDREAAPGSNGLPARGADPGPDEPASAHPSLPPSPTPRPDHTPRAERTVSPGSAPAPEKPAGPDQKGGGLAPASPPASRGADLGPRGDASE